MADIRAIEGTYGVTRDGIDRIRRRLIELAAARELFPAADFPPPSQRDRIGSRLYRLAQDDDDRFALYLNSARGSVATPPHNHTTWAVVVGFAGRELNRFYRRTEQGAVEQIGEQAVEAGSGVAMLPDELLSIHIAAAALNFHCYGLALERLDNRQYYDTRSRSWKVFPPRLDIREARIDLAPVAGSIDV
jgi:hypothetical protein